MWYHGHEVSSGRQPAAVRDLRSVSGGMNQHAVLLDGHLDRDRKTDSSASEMSGRVLKHIQEFKLTISRTNKLIEAPTRPF